MQAKYAIKVQVVRSKNQAPRFHVNFPMPLAAAIGLEGGEEVEWELLDRGKLYFAYSSESGHLFQFKADTDSN
jgi:hypothetical protein